MIDTRGDREELQMGWREDLIASYKKEVERLRGDIPLMRAGTFQFRSFENGQWVIRNEECIARDLKTIEELEGIIARAEAEEAGK
ncbi:hypothetical protein FHS21_006399 [Phyllobacterium trifolii]|jgi:hypothetical protein|uniref:Uncharacterized protein n=1 Tax=Phyllobacterium trifolii TaxID=300193 RepID=A0A839UM31_9HYPH|nr:hypothetical protein [Phyllobacterium trifolii]MBB3149940.1 hypothetical protein [Phyllobacterium trifolii]